MNRLEEDTLLEDDILETLYSRNNNFDFDFDLDEHFNVETKFSSRRILKICLALLIGTFKLWIITCFLLATAITIYLLFYNYYIPRFVHVYPVFFVHDVACLQRSSSLSTTTNCHHPKYEIMGSKGLFKRRQPYDIRIHFIMPDSDVNHDIGMFMIHLRLLDSDGNELLHSRRSALFPYSSYYVRKLQLYFLSLFYLFNYYEENRLLTVWIVDENTFDAHSIPFDLVEKIQIEIETLKSIEVVSAKLEIIARLSTFQHMMYHWPIITSIITIFVIFVSLIFFSILTSLMLKLV